MVSLVAAVEAAGTPMCLPVTLVVRAEAVLAVTTIRLPHLGRRILVAVAAEAVSIIWVVLAVLVSL